MTRHIAVAAPGQDAADAALSIGQAGGNAVDAAIAGIVVASCTEPGIVSPMGGAFINVWQPGGSPLVIDGYAEMPGRGREQARFGAGVWRVWMEYGGGLFVSGGPGSVGTPGMFAGLAEASQRYGVLPWAELLRPAAAVLRRGYPLSGSSAYYLGYATAELFARDPETVDFLAQCGTPPRTGAILRDPDLAATLDHLGSRGAGDLYTGELAHSLAAYMDAHGGLLSLADLEAYEPRIRPALRTRLGEWDLGVNPAPSIGGPVLTTMLRLLQRRREEAGHTDASDVLGIQRLVLDYRRRLIDRSEDLEAAGHELIRVLEEVGPDGLAAVATSQDTVHVSVVDSDGLACAVTTSAGYGSGVTLPGTGLALNNALGEEELNRRGLHALAPGTRLASNMAPTTARRDDGATLAIGSPGADRITTALFQVLGGLCLDHLPLQQAVDQPRLHVALDEAGTATLHYEMSDAISPVARSAGLAAAPRDQLHMFFGGVGACLHQTDGTLLAAADPRRTGGTAVG